MDDDCLLCRVFCFFFSSRRRHTRSTRDWSSDVCSSDLETFRFRRASGICRALPPAEVRDRFHLPCGTGKSRIHSWLLPVSFDAYTTSRSEERRVGKERSSPWTTRDAKRQGREEIGTDTS